MEKRRNSENLNMGTAVQQDLIPSHEATLSNVLRGLEKIGDLPIFSASVNRIRLMSSSEETGVMELANEIMKDANLTIKLLRVANSSYYNQGTIKISVISRAIVILGYETVKSITLALKVIDSFKYEHPTIDMSALLAKSFMSAGFVKDLALKSGVKDPEESYVCALLHNLGEIIIATTLSDEYEEIRNIAESENLSWEKSQKKILGTTFKDIARDVFKQWEFSDTVVKTVDNYNKKSDGPIKDKIQLNRALSSLGNSMIASLYSPGNMEERDFSELTKSLSEAAGLAPSVISASMVDSFKTSCDLAEEYGLNKKVLQPRIENVGDGKDSARDKIARSLSYHVESTLKRKPEKNIGLENEPDDLKNKKTISQEKRLLTEQKKSDQKIIVSVLNEITNLILEKSDINSIFEKILEGISYGVGFDRAILCFLSPDRKQYKARLGVGVEVDKLKNYFSFDLDEKNDLFSRTLLKGQDIFVQDVENESWRKLLPDDYIAQTNARTFVIASLKIGDKPVGLFYADMGTSDGSISSEHFSGFLQFVSQAKLALSAR